MLQNKMLVNTASWLILLSFGFSYFTGNVGIAVSTIFAFFILLAKEYVRGLNRKRVGVFFCVTLLLLWHNREMNIGGLLILLMKLFCIFSVLRLSDYTLNEVRKQFLKIFTIISGISLLFWCLYLVGIDIFPTSIIKMEGVYELENHFVFVTTFNKIEFYKRFQSVFLEPGMYGLLCVVCLVLNDFKKDLKSLVILLSCLFTLSLAAYLLLIVLIGYRYYVIKKFKLINLLLPLVILYGIYYASMNYNKGDNVLYNAIFWRLTLDDENNLASYDRRTEEFDDYYEHKVKGTTLLCGIGVAEYSKRQFENCVDIKGFLALDGIIGLLLFLLYYYRVVKTSYINRDNMLVLIVFLIIFYRGFVMSLTLGGLLLFYISMLSLGYETKLRRNENIVCPS